MAATDRWFSIAGTTLSDQDPAFRDALQEAHSRHLRPLCLCQEPNPGMYVAHVGADYVIKRLPNTGHSHAIDCPSYEPPASLSGLGDLIGEAIVEDQDDGLKNLRVGFALGRNGPRAAPTSSGAAPETATTDGKRLTIRSVLHLLWEDAELTRWVPGFAGRRNWMVVRRWLHIAATQMKVKGQPIDDMLFIPETFEIKRKEELTAKALQGLATVTADGKRHQFRLIIGEVKAITEARIGHRCMVKHLPDTPLMLPADLHSRLQKRFDTELELWAADSDNHLIIIGTVTMSKAGIVEVVEAALMTVSSSWLPIQDAYSRTLIDRLVREHRRFQVTLKYNLGRSTPIAAAILQDTRPPTALCILPANPDDKFRADFDELVNESAIPTWTWDVGTATQPPLPKPHQQQRAQAAAEEQ